VQTNQADLRRHFGIVYQELQLIPNADLLTECALRTIRPLPLSQHPTGFPEKIPKEAYRLLYELGVGENPHKWVKHMSGGEKQRVAAARVPLPGA
jgi:ABC-type lipoprotein export system ATPase subunit